MELLRAPDKELQPGDIFMGVPFFFPLLDDTGVAIDQVLRAVVGDPELWRRINVADLPANDAVRPRELAVVERRVVFAMLHINAPPCDIDKVIPPPDRKQRRDEDSALTFFQCRLRPELGDTWKAKLSRPESHIRFALLGAVDTPEGGVELAVNFRRDQQIFATQLSGLTRVASLTTDGLQVLNAAYDLYLSRSAAAG